ARRKRCPSLISLEFGCGAVALGSPRYRREVGYYHRRGRRPLERDLGKRVARPPPRSHDPARAAPHVRHLRNWLGVCPVILRKLSLKELMLEYPKAVLTSVIEVPRSDNSNLACWMRRARWYRCGGAPKVCLKARQK